MTEVLFLDYRIKRKGWGQAVTGGPWVLCCAHWERKGDRLHTQCIEGGWVNRDSIFALGPSNRLFWPCTQWQRSHFNDKWKRLANIELRVFCQHASPRSATNFHTHAFICLRWGLRIVFLRSITITLIFQLSCRFMLQWQQPKTNSPRHLSPSSPDGVLML